MGVNLKFFKLPVCLKFFLKTINVGKKEKVSINIIFSQNFCYFGFRKEKICLFSLHLLEIFYFLLFAMPCPPGD
jgi:hypothetical protein